MKEIIRQYGSTGIAVLVALSLIGVVWTYPFPSGKGLPQLMGNWLMGESGRNLQMTGNGESYRDYENMNSVQIAYTGENSMTVGKNCALDEYFFARSQQGEVLPLHAYYVTDGNGNFCPITKRNGKEYLRPESAGIYQVYLGAGEIGKREVKALLSFPVQGE